MLRVLCVGVYVSAQEGGCIRDPYIYVYVSERVCIRHPHIGRGYTCPIYTYADTLTYAYVHICVRDICFLDTLRISPTFMVTDQIYYKDTKNF